MQSQDSDNTQTIATCYLQKAGNEAHKIWLTRQHIQLLYHGRHRVFELVQVSRLAFNQRKLMLPLVGGGIAATLSLVAIFKTYASPWLMLSLLVAGVLIAYLGYQGSWVLTVHENKHHQDFFLKDISPNLRAFVNYANTFTGRQAPGMLYLPLSRQEWEQYSHSPAFMLQDTKKLCFRHEIGGVPPHLSVIVPVNSLDENIRLQWSADDQQQLYPCLLPGSSLALQETKPFFRQPSG